MKNTQIYKDIAINLIVDSIEKGNPEFNNDRYYVGLTDWGNEIVNEYIFDIIDDSF